MHFKILSTATLLILASATLIYQTSTSATELPPNPDHIYVATIGMPETVDPHWAYDTSSGEVIQNIYEPLCMFDGVKTDSFIGAVADWWPGYGLNFGNVITPSSPDSAAPADTNQTWYFHTRAMVKWQNESYGTVTPADVEYSFERGMLFDHTNGPMWMLYEPLLGKYSSEEYDLNTDGNIDEAEWTQLYAEVDNAVQSNASYVWFNSKQGHAPFQQILCQTWSSVMCKQWCVDQGLWNGQYTYEEFTRTHDPPSPGPLMDPARAMGSGPYKLKEMSASDPYYPYTGHWTLEKFDDYWRGWSIYSANLVTATCVMEWANRKALFLSTDPASQVDFCVVPRSSWGELHENNDENAPVLPGIRLYTPPVPTQDLDMIFFTYMLNTTGNPYIPLVGTTPKPDLFSDRHMRLALCYLFNFTEYIRDMYLGEAVQSPTCMPNGTRYWNGSKPMYGIDLVKAQQHLDLAWGGTVKEQGLTLKFGYNIGSSPRIVSVQMLASNLMKLTWGSMAVVDIQAVGIPWATYLPMLREKKLSVFTIGWVADYPDPDNWFWPFFQSSATYPKRQNAEYGMDPASMNWENQTFGPPPYTNAFGETVTEINNTYVDYLVSVGLQVPDMDARRQLVYEELMDIYHAEASQLPLTSPLRRHYERIWMYGSIGTFNENPAAPGSYYYAMWKLPLNVRPVEVRVCSAEISSG